MTAAWLQANGSENKDPAAEVAVSGIKELWFLSLAGLRSYCNHVTYQHFSSWAPNLPQFHHNRPDYVFSTKVDVDHKVFSDDECLKTSYIQGSALFVTGLVIDSGNEMFSHIVKSSDIFGLISDLWCSNISGFTELKSRRRLVRDLFELLCWSDLPNSTVNARLRVSGGGVSEYLAFACAFIWAVLSGGFQYRTAIERLGLRSDTETGFFLSLRGIFLDLEEGCHDDKDEGSGPDFDTCSSSWLQDLVDCGATGGGQRRTDSPSVVNK